MYCSHVELSENSKTGDPNMKDSSGRTALDYAVEKGLHYCGLILTKAENTDAADESVQYYCLNYIAASPWVSL